MIMDPYQELTVYQRSAVLMAAAKLDVFVALADGSATPSEVANRVSAPVDPVSRLLAALASLDYLSRDGEHFALNDFSKTFIRDGAGGMVRLAWKEHLFYAAWSRLADAISSGNALFPSFADRLIKDFDSVEKFLLALNDLAQMAAPGRSADGPAPARPFPRKLASTRRLDQPCPTNSAGPVLHKGVRPIGPAH